MGGEWAVLGLDVDGDARDGGRQGLEAGRQPEVVEDRRAQAGDGVAGLVEGGRGKGSGRGEFGGHVVVPRREELSGRRQVVRQAHHPLADPVMDFAGQAPALESWSSMVRAAKRSSSASRSARRW